MKTALITGSTRGIGKQIGLDLLDKDYVVYFNGHSEESCALLEKELVLKYENYRVIRTDMRYLSNIEQLISDFKYTYLDVLILNVGITDRTQFGDIKYIDWQEVMNINITLPFFLVQGLATRIKECGKIIFISSISGIVPDSVSISYGISKAGINMMIPYLAKEFAYKDVTVNAIAPGYTDTDWHKGKSEEQLQRIKNKCLAKRLGTTKEISKVALSIVDNNFINGQIIRVDGGFGLC